MKTIFRPVLLLIAPLVLVPAVATSSAAAQSNPPKIARGSFSARMTVPGTKTVYHRVWRVYPNCLGSTCSRLKLRVQRSDGRFDSVTLLRNEGLYRGRLKTRSICRGRLATSGGTISFALRITRTARRDMISGRETIITELGGSMRIESPPRVCPPTRHMGKSIRVTAERVDLPQALVVDYQHLPAAPSVTGGRNNVQFTDASAPDEDIVTRVWDFGDPASGANNKGNGRVVIHRFARAGSYRVTLTVADRWGQVTSVVGTLTVLP